MANNYYSAISGARYSEKLFSGLKRELQEGLNLYNDLINKRLKDAVQYFSPMMKCALYEIIFLLHYNHPSLQNFYIKLSADNLSTKKGSNFSHNTQINLYLKGAPSGLLGFHNLPQIFRGEMQDHINKEFRVDINQLATPEFCPIVSIASLGSIGTIAHKLEKSDLDLQVQYDLAPYLFKRDWCNDTFFLGILTTVRQWYNNLPRKKGNADEYLKTLFPILFNFQSYKSKTLNNLNGYLQLANELTKLYDIYEGRVLYERKARLESLMQKRIKQIADYIQNKYPGEEIHFFAYSTENYRQGRHGTTLEDKESSGSAYEKILTYETLMPGINFNNVVPSHFLFNSGINNNTTLYNSLISCFRLRLFDNYFIKEFNLRPEMIVNFGNTPMLTKRYLDEHRGAVYWESFKGSSGNLPKSFLNLLRLENLYSDSENRFSIIQFIKNPVTYHGLLSEIKMAADKASIQDPFGLNYDEQDPFPLQEVYRIELQNPDLLYDPWWWRYKSLKIFYQHSISLDYQSRQDISLMIDVCFALHIGLDDIFLSQYTQLNPTESTRIRVLTDYFENAFPALTAKRRFIEQVFQGELSNVNYFEKRLKKHFREAIDRILHSESDAEITAKVEEKKIWLHYYEQHFEPKKNQVPRNILSNIHRLKGRLQIAFINNNWHFKTVPTLMDKKGRFHVLGPARDQTKKVNLHIDRDLVRGLVYCIINKFYGAYRHQAIKMSSSLVEFLSYSFAGMSTHDAKHAKMTSELVERMASQIAKRFPKISVDYRQAIKSEFKVTEVIFFINVLVFGRIQMVYRDLMDNYYVVNFDHPKLNNESFKYSGQAEKLVTEETIINCIADCLKKIHMIAYKPDQLKELVSYWINPLSVDNENTIRIDRLDAFEAKLSQVLHHKVMQKLNLASSDKGSEPAVELNY